MTRAVDWLLHIAGWLASWLPPAAWVSAIAILLTVVAGSSEATAPPSWGSPDALWAAALATGWLAVASTLPAILLAVAAAVFVEEYASRSWWRLGIVWLSDALARTPPVIYGLAALEMAARLSMDSAILGAGALALAWVVSTAVFVATRDALRAVPKTVRVAGACLGATQASVLARLVLPYAARRIAHGTLVAVSRALGDAAPLLVLGAAAWSTASPADARSPLTSLAVLSYHGLAGAEASRRMDAAFAMLLLFGLCCALQVLATSLATGPAEQIE